MWRTHKKKNNKTKNNDSSNGDDNDDDNNSSSGKKSVVVDSVSSLSSTKVEAHKRNAQRASKAVATTSTEKMKSNCEICQSKFDTNMV